ASLRRPRRSSLPLRQLQRWYRACAARCAMLRAMDLGIRGRTAMVAAASKGLGKAIAAALVKEGARVSIAARSAEPLAATERQLRAAGGDVLALPVDVTRAEDLERWHAATVERFGAPALLVTNTRAPPAGRPPQL